MRCEDTSRELSNESRDRDLKRPVCDRYEMNRTANRAGERNTRPRLRAWSTHLQVGRYQDVFVQRGEALRLKSRNCIFDSVVVPNCVVYPV